MSLPNSNSYGAGDINQNQKAGKLFPSMTTTQRGTIAGTDLFEGLTIYNTTTHKLNFYNGTAWEVVTSA